MSSIFEEFESLYEKEYTVEEITDSYILDSKNNIKQAQEMLQIQGINNTYAGIDKSNWKKLLSFEKTETIPWEHVTMTLDVSCLKDINGYKLEELSIPSFVEELESIGDKNNSGFGYNESGRNFLRNISIHNNVIAIADSTFAFYKRLETISFEKDCSLISIGKQAFAYCESLQILDLRNCKYLEEIPDNCFIYSGIEILKLSNKVNSMKPLYNTDIKTVFIDNDRYNVDEFNQRLEEIQVTPDSREVFWGEVDYTF